MQNNKINQVFKKIIINYYFKKLLKKMYSYRKITRVQTAYFTHTYARKNARTHARTHFTKCCSYNFHKIL